jgi:hypothetical protein
MLIIANQFLKDKTRPIYFTQGVKLEEIKKTIKDENPKNIFNKTIMIY